MRLNIVTFGLFWACLSTSWSQSIDLNPKRSGYESPEQAVLYPILARLVEQKNWIFGRFWDLDESVWSLEARDWFLDALDEEIDEKDDGCLACTGFVNLVQAVLDSGATYEQIKNATMDVCYRIVPPAGYDPVKLCEPILDTYTIHVLYVLNTTDKSAREFCILYNSCTPWANETETSDKPELKEQPTSGGWESTSGGWESTSGIDSRESRASAYAGTIQLLHVTDIHFDAWYAEGTPVDCDMPLCCREENNGTGSARYWGDYECNIPIRTVDLILDHIRQNFDPAFIIYSGDTPQHTVWDQPQDETLSIMQWLTDSFTEYFPGVPAFVGIGNHDTSPTNLYYIPRPEIQELNQAYFDMWKPLSGFTDEQWETYERGAYYSISVFPGLRILTYNSLYFALDNFYSVLNHVGTDYTEMQKFMEETLSTARTNNEKVIVVGHHPTGGSGMFKEYSHYITDIHARYGDVIILHLLGHSHSDWFALVKDFITGETQGVQLSGPSFTSYTDINPSYRIIYLDATTYEPIDMVTYRLDLAADGNNPTPLIQFTYSHAEEYNMTDMSPKSFDDLANRLEADRDLLNLYRYNKETRVYPMGSCDDNCAKGELCGMRYTDYERRNECNSNGL